VQLPSGRTCITVSLHTTDVERTDHDVAATLEAIRRLMEATV
jgi:hypothetical protein